MPGSFSRNYDTVAPTVTLSTTAPNPTRVSPIPVTVHWTESVTGFDGGDVTPTNATVSNFVGSGADYSFDLIASGQGDVSAAVNAGVCADAAGNGNTATTPLTRTYDTVAPTATLSSTAPDPTRTSPIPVTVHWTESVTGFTSGDVTPTNATVGNFTGSGSDYSFDLVPSTQGLVTATINPGAAQDAAGNANTTGASLSRTYDSVPPTADITLLTTTPTGADSVVFGVTFGEPVGSSFTDADVSLASGGLAGSVQVAGTDPSYTVTVHLTDPNADGFVGVVIGTAVSDLAGNGYAGGASPIGEVYNWHGFRSGPQGTVNAYIGGTHTFRVEPDCGASTLAYHWWFDKGAKAATPIGSNADTVTIEPVTADSAGKYWCGVTYDGSTYVSNTATLTVADHLAITEPPADADKHVGDSHTFTVATGGGFLPLTYQWKKDTVAIPGATGATFTLAPLKEIDTGAYTVDVADAGTDTLTSPPADLTVVQGLPLAGFALLTLLLAGCAMGYIASRRRKEED